MILGVLAAGGGAEELVPKFSRPPNVVLIAIDTLRSDHLGCYGYRRRTSPNMDRLASEGVVFEQCYSVASWTRPSFMSMFTGLLPEVHGCKGGTAALSSSIATLPEHFKRAGYFCAGVISNKNISGKYGFGRGFDVYDDYTIFLEMDLTNLTEEVRPDLTFSLRDLVTGEAVTRRAKQLLDEAKKSGKPFFLFAMYFDPHFDYVPPPPYDRMFDPDYKGSVDGRGIKDMRNDPPAGADLQHLVALYDGEIAYEDAQIGELLKKLDAIAKPGDTLTILVSDHGEAFGEHHHMTHGNSAYREEVCVPMIWRWPGVLPKGHRVKAAVSNMEMVKTLAQLMRFENFGPVQGQSLWPALRGGQLPMDRIVFSQIALRTDDHAALTQAALRLHARFARSPDAPDVAFELYNVSRDPGETKNVIDSAQADVERMKQILKNTWSECRALRTYYHQGKENPQVPLTDEERRYLEALGYVGGCAP